MTVSHLNQKTTDLQFELVPNPYKQHLQGFWNYTARLFLPVLAIHFFLLLAFSLSVAVHLGILGAISFALFLRILFSQRQSSVSNNHFLVIGPKHLAIRHDEQSVSNIDRQSLVIEAIGWGPCEEELLPAVRIRLGSEMITIGTTSSETSWTNLQQSVQATDYLLTKKDWEICARTLGFPPS